MDSKLPSETAAIQAEQVRQVYAGVPVALIANLSIASVLAYVQSEVVPSLSVASWLIALTFILLLRLALFGEYRRALSRNAIAEAPARWLRIFRILSIATGAVWGLAAFLLFPPGDLPHQAFLSFVLAGLAAGAMTSLAADFISAVGFAIPSILPLTFNLLMMSHEKMHLFMGAMTLFFITFLVTTGRRTQHILLETASLRIADLRHTAALHAQQQNLRSILDNAPIGIWRQDRNGRLLFVNRFFCENVGIPEERFLAVPHYAELFDETMARNCIASDMAAYVATGPQLSYEEVMFVDGHIHDLEITKFRLQDEEGDIDGLIGLAADRTEARRLNLALRENEARTRLILENSLDGIVTMNQSGIITDWNPEAERIFGHRAAQAIGQDLGSLIVPPAHREAHKEGLKRFLTSGHQKVLGSRMEVTALRADGTEFPVELSISAPAQQGAERFFSAFIRDLTEQNNTKAKLASNREQLQAILDNVADAIITMDEHGIVQSFNHAAEQSFGYAADEVIGHNIRMLMPEPHRARHDNYLQRYLETGVPHLIGLRREVEGRRKDGSLLPISLAVSTLQHDGHPLFIGMIHDISESKRIEWELQAGRDRATQALEALKQQKYALDQHAIVAITDVKGRILYANDKFCAISGYTREELLGQDHAMLNSGHHPHGFFKEMYHTIAQGATWNDEICNRAKDGHLYWVDTTIVPFMGEDGKPEQYIAIRADVTKRKQAETELLKHRDHLQELVMEQTTGLVAAKESAERANEAKSEFLANMSHELRTPMHAILSFSELGESKVEEATPEKLKSYFHRIQDSGKRLLNLLNDLLDLSKLEAGKMMLRQHPHDLFNLAQEVLAEFESLIQSHKLDLQLESGNCITIAEVDEMRFMQIVRNLVANAIKFTPPGGMLALRFSAAELPRGRRGSDIGMVPAIRLEISDSGVGIPENELEAVFDKFVQSSMTSSKAGGTGLGLAICRELIEAHHGTIFAHNNASGGATFVITLPLTPALPAQPTGTPS